MRIFGFLAVIVMLSGCRTAANNSATKDAAASDVVVPPDSPTDGVTGMDILENVPAITQIAADVDPASDWEFTSGREYWLYSSRGRYMTFSTNNYHPYQNESACDGLEDDPNSACSVSPSKVAQECQRIASTTLKALMENEPAEYKELQEKFGGRFSLFGWMNDGYSDGENSTATWQGPFIWRGDRDGVQVGGECPTDFVRLDGYLKWVSSIDKSGECRTPSKGQFLTLIAQAKKCLEQNGN